MPAAAVIRGGQALIGFIGRKGRVGGFVSQVLNTHRLTGEMRLKLQGLSAVEERGIPGVAVKCVDIRRSTGGEGGALDRN